MLPSCSLSTLHRLLRQANGAKEYLTIGTVFQRALLITTLFCAVFLLPLWLNVGRVFVAFGALSAAVLC